jgi:hypothetical protein
MSERLIDSVCPQCERIGTTVRVVKNEDGFAKLSRLCKECGGEWTNTFDADWLAVAKIRRLEAEIERLREALALGSEVLASHQGTLKREWHNVGAWLYAGDTINVVRAPLPEIAAPESAEGDR